MDLVFRALNDRSRRLLLDQLFEEDGQTLAGLCEHLPGMTRFGVMNHLKVLEEAGLITTRKVGRVKYHYLNPVPIRQVHDRWISKYTEPVVGRIAGLKAHLEEGGAPMPAPVHVYQTFIKATPQEVWRAITDGEVTVKYFYGTRVESDWEPGAQVTYRGEDGVLVADGEVLAIDPGRRLEMTFVARWDEELEAEGAAREVWIIEDVGGATKLTVELFDVDVSDKRYGEYSGGFAYIVSGMKTLLETGEPLTVG